MTGELYILTNRLKAKESRGSLDVSHSGVDSFLFVTISGMDKQAFYFSKGWNFGKVKRGHLALRLLFGVFRLACLSMCGCLWNGLRVNWVCSCFWGSSVNGVRSVPAETGGKCSFIYVLD